MLQWKVEEAVEDARTTSVGRRSRPGCPPVPRRRTTLVNTSAVAPPGLPSNCYNPLWVANLKRYDRLRLQMVEEPHNCVT